MPKWGSTEIFSKKFISLKLLNILLVITFNDKLRPPYPIMKHLILQGFSKINLRKIFQILKNKIKKEL